MRTFELNIISTAKNFAKIGLADLKSEYDIKLKVTHSHTKKPEPADTYLCSAIVSEANKTRLEKVKHLFRKMPRVEIRKKMIDFTGDTIEDLEKTLIKTAKLAVDVFSGKPVKIN